MILYETENKSKRFMPLNSDMLFSILINNETLICCPSGKRNAANKLSAKKPQKGKCST